MLKVALDPAMVVVAVDPGKVSNRVWVSDGTGLLEQPVSVPASRLQQRSCSTLSRWDDRGARVARGWDCHGSGPAQVRRSRCPGCMRPSERFLPSSPDGGVVSSTWRNRRLATVGPPEHCAVSDGLGLWFGSKSLRRVAAIPERPV